MAREHDMADEETTTRELVARAMAATEIAESATDATLRAAFFSLAAFWLEEAERLCKSHATRQPASALEGGGGCTSV
jgi:hypothetical protein